MLAPPGGAGLSPAVRLRPPQGSRLAVAVAAPGLVVVPFQMSRSESLLRVYGLWAVRARVHAKTRAVICYGGYRYIIATRRNDVNDEMVFNFFFKGRFAVQSIRCFGKCNHQIKNLLETNEGNYYHLNLLARYSYKTKNKKCAASRFSIGGFPGVATSSVKQGFIWPYNVQALSAKRALEVALRTIYEVDLYKKLPANAWWFCNVLDINVLE